jgi:hypothetical protein
LDTHLENLRTISQKQHWNAIHREPGRRDALESGFSTRVPREIVIEKISFVARGTTQKE